MQLVKDCKVYIIILNYNGWQDTIECLESVLKNYYSNYQIIVTDNDSPNKSMEYIIQWAEGQQQVSYISDSQLKHLSQPYISKPIDYVYYSKEEAINGGDCIKEGLRTNPLILIQTGENGGFSAGNNIAIQYALAKNDFEYICLLNNDTVVDKRFLNALTEKAIDSSLGIAGSTIYYYDKPDELWFNGGTFSHWTSRSHHVYDKTDREITQHDFITGACMLIRKDVLRNVGLLDENYFLYSEDLDYCYRALKMNYTLGVVHSSKIWHKVGASSKNETSSFSAYFMYRNSIRFCMKNFSLTKRIFSFLYDLYAIPLLILKLSIRNPKLIPVLLKGTVDGLFGTKIFSPNGK